MFDRVFLWVEKPRSNHKKTTVICFFCHDHWVLEGSQATVKPQQTTVKPQTNHGHTTNQPQKHGHPTSQAESNRTEPHQAEPSRAKPSQTVPHHTTPSHATLKQAMSRTGPAEPSQAISPRPFPVQGECSRCQRLTRLLYRVRAGHGRANSC